MCLLGRLVTSENDYNAYLVSFVAIEVFWVTSYFIVAASTLGSRYTIGDYLQIQIKNAQVATYCCISN